MALQKKKLADTSAAGAGGARSGGSAQRDQRNGAKGGTPQVPHKGHVLQQRSFGGKKPSAAKKKEEIHLEFCNFPLQSLANF